MPVLGLVVEGEYDLEALSIFTGRLNDSQIDIRPRLCRGAVQGRYVRILSELSATAQPDRLVVVSDAHGSDHEALAASLRQQISRQEFRCPVEFVIIVQELEALLLADPRAIEAVCVNRGTPAGRLDNLVDTPERIQDPKKRLQAILSQNAGTAYTKAVAREIALAADLNALSNWCPSFRRLREAVRF